MLSEPNLTQNPTMMPEPVSYAAHSAQVAISRTPPRNTVHCQQQFEAFICRELNSKQALHIPQNNRHRMYRTQQLLAPQLTVRLC
jgi:hypothetical protein